MVGVAPGFAGAKQGHGIHQPGEATGVDDPDAPPVAATGDALGETQVGRHRRRRVQEPGAQQARGVVGVALVAVEPPGPGQGLNRLLQVFQGPSVPVLEGRIDLAIAADPGQTVGALRVRPPVGSQGDEVVGRGSRRQVLAGTYHAEGPALQGGGRLASEQLSGGGDGLAPGDQGRAGRQRGVGGVHPRTSASIRFRLASSRGSSSRGFDHWPSHSPEQ